MTAFKVKTPAEQKLRHLQRLKRPLTDEESEELRRSMHAVYERNRRHSVVAQHRNEELKLLEKLRAEARKPERYPQQ